MTAATEFFAELYSGTDQSILVLDGEQNCIFMSSKLMERYGERAESLLLTEAVKKEAVDCLASMRCGTFPLMGENGPLDLELLPYPYEGAVYAVICIKDRTGALSDEGLMTVLRNCHGKQASYLNEIFSVAQRLGVESPMGRELSDGVRRILRMNSHLYELLDGSGKTRYRVPLDLQDFINGFTRNYNEADPRLKVRYLAGEEGLYAMVMPEDLELALGALFSNALRFSKDQVMVSAGRQGDQIYISVCDNGDGVEQPDRLFELGYRTVDRFGVTGLGFGLSVAKKLLELQGATLLYERRGGETCFKILTKAVDLPEGRLAAWQPEDLSNSLSQLRIEMSDIVKEMDLR